MKRKRIKNMNKEKRRREKRDNSVYIYIYLRYLDLLGIQGEDSFRRTFSVLKKERGNKRGEKKIIDREEKEKE